MHPLIFRKKEYKSFRNVRCGCANCYDTAYSQMYICALGGYVALCKLHDRCINQSALLIVTQFDQLEADKWMIKYTSLPDDSPQRRFEPHEPAGS